MTTSKHVEDTSVKGSEPETDPAPAMPWEAVPPPPYTPPAAAPDTPIMIALRRLGIDPVAFAELAVYERTWEAGLAEVLMLAIVRTEDPLPVAIVGALEDDIRALADLAERIEAFKPLATLLNAMRLRARVGREVMARLCDALE